MVIISMTLPYNAMAWFLSSAEAQETPIISAYSEGVQKMSLLTPSVAMISDRKAVDESMDIHITDNEAVVADIGVLGTSIDMIDIPESDTISTHVVQSGDTVLKVAKRYGVSENTVRWANSLGKKDVLQVGQTLVILPITGVKHKVQKGDTLDSIAKKYKADKKDIFDYNDIADNELLVAGETIIIPDGEIITVVTAKTPSQNNKVATGAGLKKTGVSSTKGYYIQPVVPDGGRIRKTQGFHDRYNAIDVGAPIGTPIRAMADGKVIVTKSPNNYNGGYGGLTIVSHANNSQTLYAHQSRIIVSVGDTVKQGQIIGYTGNTGRSTGPHLHYEIRGVYPTPILY